MSMELLGYISKNANMGEEATRQVAARVEDGRTLAKLADQIQDYQQIAYEADKLLQQQGCDPKESDLLEKTMSYIGINAKLLVDSSPAHVAKMMMQGSTMGTADITQRLAQCQNADAESVKLAKKLLKLEEQWLADWQLFLADHA